VVTRTEGPVPRPKNASISRTWWTGPLLTRPGASLLGALSDVSPATSRSGSHSLCSDRSAASPAAKPTRPLTPHSSLSGKRRAPSRAGPGLTETGFVESHRRSSERNGFSDRDWVHVRGAGRPRRSDVQAGRERAHERGSHAAFIRSEGGDFTGAVVTAPVFALFGGGGSIAPGGSRCSLPSSRPRSS
jgi:hypothetical protein